jgi:hypothetical protein
MNRETTQPGILQENAAKTGSEVVQRTDAHGNPITGAVGDVVQAESSKVVNGIVSDVGGAVAHLHQPQRLLLGEFQKLAARYHAVLAMLGDDFDDAKADFEGHIEHVVDLFKGAAEDNASAATPAKTDTSGTDTSGAEDTNAGAGAGTGSGADLSGAGGPAAPLGGVTGTSAEQDAANQGSGSASSQSTGTTAGGANTANNTAGNAAGANAGDKAGDGTGDGADNAGGASGEGEGNESGAQSGENGAGDGAGDGTSNAGGTSAPVGGEALK